MKKKLKNIVIFGSTGFVGRQALEVIAQLGMKVLAVTAKRNVEVMEQQIREFKPKYAVMVDDCAAKELKFKVRDTNTKILCGKKELCNPNIFADSDLIINSIVGIAGLNPSFCALSLKKTLALANKESLVVAGKILTNLARKNNVKILPVDSEHAAIFQCLNGNFSNKYLKKILLTASGGPFFGKKKSDLVNVSVAEALRHPTWSMGEKITIDSATMINKGFELIEAHWLFGIDAQNIDILIHRESIVHSMVEFLDNSIVAHLSVPDMKLPLQYAITYPEKCLGLTKSLDLCYISKLTFFKPDNFAFEAVDLCRGLLAAGGTLTTVLNAANEVAVDLFLKNKISFLDIVEIVKFTCKEYKNNPLNSIKDIFYADTWARNFLTENVGNFIKNIK